MPQIHAVHNAANAVGTQAPNQPELSTQARTALRQRITDVVQRFEVLPYQERRLARTQGQQAAYVIGRVLGGIVTLGVSEGVIAIGHKAEKLNAQNLREQAVSRLTAAAYANEAIGRAVQSGAGFPSPAYESAVEEAVAELRARFGSVLPEGAADLAGLPFARELSSAVKAALAQMADEASPEQLKALVVEKGIPFMRKAALQQEVGRACETLGHAEADLADMAALLLERNPDLARALGDDVQGYGTASVLRAFRADIEAFAAHVTSFSASRKAAQDHAVAVLAEACGVSAEEMGLHLNLGKLNLQLDDAEPEMGTPEAAMRQACMAKADGLIRRKVELLRSADELEVSPELKAYWKERVLADKTLNDPDTFRSAVAVASRVEENKIAGIEELFRSGRPDADTAYAALQSLSLSMDIALAEVHDWRTLDGDKKGLARFHALKALLDRMPAFRTAFESDAALLADMEVRAGKDMASMDERVNIPAEVSEYLVLALKTRSVDRAVLAASIGDPGKMPVPFLAALRQAEAEVRSRFPGVELPADFMQAYPFGGSRLSNLLREAVENSGGALSPEGFAGLAGRLMNRVAADVVARQTIAERLEQVDVEGTRAFTHRENVDDALLALFKRHPELVEALSGAFGPQAVRDVLGRLDDLAPMLRFFADSSRAWAAGERYLYRRMAEATGLPEADVRERLNTAGILRGSAFNYQRSDWIDILKDPAQLLAALPSAEEMIQLYEGMAERFASRKGALYQSVDGLPGLSADYRAELKEAVLKRSELKLPFFFERCSRTAQGMYAAPLLRAIEAGEDVGTLLEAVRRLARQYDSASHVTFSPTTLADMGSDELSSIQSYSLGMFMDLNPALRGSLAPERGNPLIDRMVEEMSLIGRELSRVRPDTPAYVQAKARYGQAATVIALLNNMTRQG